MLKSFIIMLYGGALRTRPVADSPCQVLARSIPDEHTFTLKRDMRDPLSCEICGSSPWLQPPAAPLPGVRNWIVPA